MALQVKLWCSVRGGRKPPPKGCSRISQFLACGGRSRRTPWRKLDRVTAYLRFQGVNSKLRNQIAEFYKHALLLLAYSPLSSMPADEALAISFDLGIAALVGEGLYNFGELLEHPVVATLESTEFGWLADLLRAFNAGDIDQYELLVAQHHAQQRGPRAAVAHEDGVAPREAGRRVR